MNKNQDKPTTTNIVFENTVCTQPWNLRTQELDISVDSWDTIEDCLAKMLVDKDEFITLTTANAHRNIRFIQATQIEDGITVELGIEEGDHTRLVEKTCTEEECLNIFQEFFSSADVQDLEKYHPVEFFT
ncbi:hypothetical protein D7X87_06660 [bacterium D16-54]|nr:hypothetical protein D7X87_06660 [bacterium D16-54]RKJ15741.1 hypothetical protein D7X65_06655 [bacterium D16-56]